MGDVDPAVTPEQFIKNHYLNNRTEIPLHFSAILLWLYYNYHPMEYNVFSQFFDIPLQPF